MRTQEANLREGAIEERVDPRGRPGDRRSERHAPEAKSASREQSPHLVARYSSHIRIPTVVIRKVVPDELPPFLERPDNFAGYCRPHLCIENGREDSELHGQVECFIRKWKLRPAGHRVSDAGRAAVGDFEPVIEKIDSTALFGFGTEIEKVPEKVSRAAADIQNPQSGQAYESLSPENLSQ